MPKRKHDQELNRLTNAAWCEFVDQHPPVKNESNVKYQDRLKVGFTKILEKLGITVPA